MRFHIEPHIRQALDPPHVFVISILAVGHPGSGCATEKEPESVLAIWKTLKEVVGCFVAGWTSPPDGRVRNACEEELRLRIGWLGSVIAKYRHDQQDETEQEHRPCCHMFSL